MAERGDTARVRALVELWDRWYDQTDESLEWRDVYRELSAVLPHLDADEMQRFFGAVGAL